MRKFVWPFVWLFLVFVTSAKGAVKKQSCYVCIPNTGLSIQDVLALFPSGPTIPLCNQFKPRQPKFIRDCPTNKNYDGCSTIINGTHVTKSCSEYGLNDCQTANNISYCYCKGDICNAERVPEEEPRPPMEASPEHSDDEDSSESSGFSSIEDSEINSRIPKGEDDIHIEHVKKDSDGPQHTSPTPKIAGSTSSTHSLSLFTVIVASMVFVIHINNDF